MAPPQPGPGPGPAHGPASPKVPRHSCGAWFTGPDWRGCWFPELDNPGCERVGEQNSLLWVRMSLGGKLTDETDTFHPSAALSPPSPTFGSVRGGHPLPRAGSDWPGLQATSPAHPQPLAGQASAPSCCGSFGIHPQS